LVRLSPIVVSALARRELLIAVSYRMSLLLTLGYGVLGLALYYFISRTFEGVSSSDLGAAPSYFAYAAVGIVVGTMVDATSSSVGTRMREEQTTGTLEALATTPMSSLELPVGVVSFPFVFATMQAGVYLLVASLWMSLDTSHTSWTGLALVLVAAGAALAPIGVLAGAAVIALKRGQMISAITVYLMSILGGMLFPVSVLPGWLQPLANLMPVKYAFDGARDALFSGAEWETDALILAAWAVVLWPAAIVLFDRAGAFAKRKGSLSEY
jgi:ABC-2 type transport system permease protein